MLRRRGRLSDATHYHFYPQSALRKANLQHSGRAVNMGKAVFAGLDSEINGKMTG